MKKVNTDVAIIAHNIPTSEVIAAREAKKADSIQRASDFVRTEKLAEDRIAAIMKLAEDKKHAFIASNMQFALNAKGSGFHFVIVPKNLNFTPPFENLDGLRAWIEDNKVPAKFLYIVTKRYGMQPVGLLKNIADKDAAFTVLKLLMLFEKDKIYRIPSGTSITNILNAINSQTYSALTTEFIKEVVAKESEKAS